MSSLAAAAAATNLALPTQFPYVALVGSLTPFLTIWQTMVVSKARKEAGVMYPTYMVEEKEAKAGSAKYRFNCAQRAHANTLEALPTFLFCLTYAGLFKPVTAASFGAVWLVGRVLYTLGYSTGEPKKRNARGGLLHVIGYLGVIGTSIFVSGQHVYNLLK